MSELVSVSDAAARVGVSADTIRRWSKRGLIRCVRDSRNYRLFDLDVVDQLHKKLSGHSTTNMYRVLEAAEPSKYTCIDLFAGAGGTALGMHHAGLQHTLLSEIDKDAVATLQTNMPQWNVVSGDVRELSFEGLSADVVQAGFPCQAFSYAGKSRGFEDTRGTLFYEFARCVRDVRPKLAIGENVRGLVNHDNGRTLKTMIGVLQGLGYKVAYRLLRAQYLDVPQKRERLILMALRADLDAPLLFPSERDYTVSVREALEACPSSPGQTYTERKKEVMELVPAGGCWRDLPDAVQRSYMGASYHLGGGKTGMARRLAWEEPALTLTCNPAQKQTERCHPSETRPLQTREYARLQTFPDSWEFCGSTASVYRQIGNAVPVNLAYHVGSCAVAMLNGSHDPLTMEEQAPVENLVGIV